MPRETTPDETRPTVPPGRLATECLLGWLVPGAGHLLRGERTKGLVFLIAVSLAFLLGQWMTQTCLDDRLPRAFDPTDFHAVSVDEHPYYFAAQLGTALPTLSFAAYDRYIREPVRRPLDDPIDPHLSRLFDTGLLLTGLAGLLNYLVVLELLDPNRDRRRRREAAKEADE